MEYPSHIRSQYTFGMEKYVSHVWLGRPGVVISVLLTLIWTAPVWADRVDDIISGQMSTQHIPGLALVGQEFPLFRPCDYCASFILLRNVL
jgi:hypothetical protein